MSQNIPFPSGVPQPRSVQVDAMMFVQQVVYGPIMSIGFKFLLSTLLSNEQKIAFADMLKKVILQHIEGWQQQAENQPEFRELRITGQLKRIVGLMKTQLAKVIQDLVEVQIEIPLASDEELPKSSTLVIPTT